MIQSSFDWVHAWIRYIRGSKETNPGQWCPINLQQPYNLVSIYIPYPNLNIVEVISFHIQYLYRSTKCSTSVKRGKIKKSNVCLLPLFQTKQIQDHGPSPPQMYAHVVVCLVLGPNYFNCWTLSMSVPSTLK